MKKYIKPVSDIIEITTDKILNGMSETALPFIPDNNDNNIIGNGNEVLNNENYVWDMLEDKLY